MVDVRTRRLTRNKLAEAFKSHEMVKAFEDLTIDVGTTIPEAVVGNSGAVAKALALAGFALMQSSEDGEPGMPGAQGLQGAPGQTVVIPGMDGEDGEPGMMQSPKAPVTLAVTGATYSAGAGVVLVKTDDTFDGYTLAQVVRALRQFGILA